MHAKQIDSLKESWYIGWDMTREQLKSETLQIIDHLPDEASWDDLMYRIYVRQKIDRGIADSEAGRVYTSDEIRKELGLDP